MTTSTEKRYIEDLDPVEFMAVLDEGGRKYNEECDRLGISRVVGIDGQAVLYHPDGTYTPLPKDRAGMDALFKKYKVFSDEQQCP
ncbi:MAG: hypothetical protein OXP36_09965 [Gammaproteobacteria bacterium]|nr:hypothetical protein [Gammaproteobacteria bacterium]